MTAILDLITGGIGPYLIAALGAMAALVMAFFRGKASANAKRDARDANAKIKALETSEDVKNAVAAKTDAARRADLGRWVRPE
jgi:hypothetical protein